jgi:iron complex transport system ATP-binding protein
MAEAPPALAVRELTVVRGARAVLERVALSLRAGEVLAVLGPNGAGKTTLLRALSGLAPYSGEILLGGEPLSALSPEQRARRVTFVPQESELRAALAVREVVALGRYARGGFGGALTRRRSLDDTEHVARALVDTDVEELAERAFSDLSTGEKKRVLIARALCTEAPILLLDEPTAALDIQHALALFALLRRVTESGRAVIVVLHQIEQALEFADSALLLRRGAAIALGPVRDVVTAQYVRELYGVELIPNAAPGFRLLPGRP